MTNNADEKNQRQQDLELALNWLADAREWAKLAKHLHTVTEALSDNDSARTSKLNVARACLATAFQLTFNGFLVAEAKWPRQDDSLERANNRLNSDTQSDIDTSIGIAKCADISSVSRSLDHYLRQYNTPTRQTDSVDGTEQSANHHLEIPRLAALFKDLAAFAEHKITNPKASTLPNRLKSSEARTTVREKIQQIICASHDGDYIYRGEPEHYDKLTSNLYRRYRHHFETPGRRLKIDSVHKEILTEVKGYTEEAIDFDASTRLQHFGGKTNLIDFTTDCLIALFFACDGGSDDDGRVILLRKSIAIKNGHTIEQPRILENRVKAQKSIFVCPIGGFIEDGQFNVIPIPNELKKPMLEHLNEHHGISPNTIYNDLHGYVKYQELHHSSYDAFFEGLKHHDNARELQRGGLGDDAKHKFDLARRHYNRALEINPQFATAYHHRAAANRNLGQIDCAINDSSRALELNSNYVAAYSTRGLAYLEKREYQPAVQDFTHVINRARDDAGAYFNRALAHMHLLNWGKVKDDLKTARQLSIDLLIERENRYPTISCLEDSIGAVLPDDIANMLEHAQSPCNTSN